MRQRDNQRTKVYEAENTLSPVSRVFITVDEMQVFINNVIGSARFKNRFKLNKPIRVSDGRGRRRACCANFYYEYRLKMPKWARTDYILLHELAHAITEDKYAWHGPEFCANYLYLIQNFMEHNEAYTLLVDSFKETGVRFSV
jgi:putative metallohydrolase (TIGR04338 family)